MLQITEANVGDIFLFPNSGKQIKVVGLNKDYVYYLTEAGGRYSSSERCFDAVKLTAPAEIDQFEKNVQLGRHLNAAEQSAMRKILNGTGTPAERDDAIRALGTTRKQQEHLESRINAAAKARQRKPSLSDMIAAAENKKPSVRESGHGINRDGAVR